MLPNHCYSVYRRLTVRRVLMLYKVYGISTLLAVSWRYTRKNKFTRTYYLNGCHGKIRTDVNIANTLCGQRNSDFTDEKVKSAQISCIKTKGQSARCMLLLFVTILKVHRHGDIVLFYMRYPGFMGRPTFTSYLRLVSHVSTEGWSVYE